MVWDAADGYALLFGGYLKVPRVQQYYGESDTWTYLNGVWNNVTNTVIGGAPPDALGPSMAYDPFSQEVVLFGGGSDVQGNFQAQTWTYHAGEWTNITNTAGTPPFPREIAVLVADLADQQMVLFGGLSQNATRTREYAQTDTWLLKDNIWNNITSQVSGSPPTLIYASGAYDPAESGVVVLGTNFPGPSFVSYTYLYAAGKWTNLTSALPTPGPRQVAGIFVYDPSIGGLILSSSLEVQGGSPGFDMYPITWAFYAGNWINITTTAGAFPSGTLAGGALLPDGTIFAFGGTNDSVDNTDYSYVFSLPPTISVFAVTPTLVDQGAPVAAAASVSNGVSPFFQNISWGDGTYSQGNSTASHTYSKSGNFTVTYSLKDFVGRSGTRSANVTVQIKPSNSPGGFSWTSGTGLYLLIAFILVIVAAVAVLGLFRSRRKPTAAPPPVALYTSPLGPPSDAFGPGPPPP
ncbi:MAG: PKD domain-containing protein [Thermoplasmata archaeon]